jgi:hypothetical protein
MRTKLTGLIAIALLLTGVAASAQTPAPAAKAPDITGKWTMVLELSIGTSNPTLVLKQDDDKLSGTYTGRYGEFKLTGKVAADRTLQFSVALEAEGQAVTMYFSGEVAADGQTIAKGVCSIEGLGDGSWAAKKEKTQ